MSSARAGRALRCAARALGPRFARGVALAASIAAALLGCDSPAPVEAPVAARQPARAPRGAVVARVGGAPITSDLVARIAATHGIDVARARDLAIRDALLAREAEAQGLASTPETRVLVDAAITRHLLHSLQARVGEPPIADGELASATARHWLDLERPEGHRTVHAVVRLDATADQAKRARAVAIAEAIRAAVLPIRAQAASMPLPARAAGALPPSSYGKPATEDADPLAAAFLEAANRVAHEGFDVVVQPLPAVTAAGRVYHPAERQFDPDFARAAAALPARGDVSPVSPSSAGVHVIMLLERLPAQIVPLDERRRVVRPEIVTERARAAQQRILADLRKQSSTVPDADAHLALVTVDR